MIARSIVVHLADGFDYVLSLSKDVGGENLIA